eukprot:CAMPEP_0172665504 /NCGR_PEP_ID=MMETSP1074-20121228/7306_1 /TAXON_ID=2916 /ORGANISM="Ceratium fusus, Strain PA161109" /LENGTH=526 /DNA_ID=CAMNT_0013481845 /DNA_START=26 /DNA_END=1606 /DNA_ORIENTATION=-
MPPRPLKLRGTPYAPCPTSSGCLAVKSVDAAESLPTTLQNFQPQELQPNTSQDQGDSASTWVMISGRDPEGAGTDACDSGEAVAHNAPDWLGGGIRTQQNLDVPIEPTACMSTTGADSTIAACGNCIFKEEELDRPALSHVEGQYPQATVVASLRAHAQNLEHELEAVKLSACVREKQLMAAQQEEAALRQQAEAQLAHVKSELATERKRAEAEREQAASKPAAVDANFASPRSSDGRDENEFELPDFVWKCGSSEVMAFVQGIMRENAALRKLRSASGRLRVAMGPLGVTPSRSPVLTARGGGDNSSIDFASLLSGQDGHCAQDLVTRLREHAEDPQACAQVCVALETVTFTNPETRLAVVEHGGIQAVLDVLRQHHEARGPSLLPAVEVLWNLTFEDAAVESATAAGAIQHVTALMQTNGDQAELLGAACAVLVNLAVQQQNCWTIMEGGSAALVASAVQRHSGSAELLELGCQALYMLACHQDMRTLVRAAGGGQAAELAASCSQSPGGAQKWGKWLQEVLAS